MTKPKTTQFFIYSAGVLLLLTAIAKLISGGGGARIMQTPDPLLGLPFRQVFLAVGGVELVIALLCLATRRVWLQLGLVAWLATNFLVYRLGLLWIGYHRPCGCLGNLTDALGISPKTADVAMKLVLAYLLVGSYAALYWLWQSSRQRPVTAKAVLTPVDSSPAPSA